MKVEDRIDDAILGKFLAGEAGPDEAILITDWIAMSEVNSARFTELERTWTLGKDNVRPTPKKNLVLERLQQTILVDKPKASNVMVVSYGLAASVLIIISICVAYLFLESPKVSCDLWETKYTQNEVLGFSLPDGSSVTVNRNSILRWRREMEGEKREITLVGEAYFDVTPDSQRPFIISTGDIQIRVLGTAFNVLDSKETNEIETEVTRGKVIMSSKQKQIVIEAGMKGIYNKITKELILLKSKDGNSIAYCTHSLSFHSAKLSEVCKQLSKTYGVRFVFQNGHIKDCLLTSAFNDKSLLFIMNVISESLSIKYQLKGNTVYLSGDGCL